MTSWDEITHAAPDFARRVQAKLAGRAVADDDGFRIDVAEAVLTRIGEPAEHLAIESWHPGRGHQRRTRT